ncbi:hypothetical protein GOV10_04290 [Candidatus Woesearchaeota archaeon]|nr:hypothetical protein [Candidatus Woesearchaeota archaeon]
MDFKIQPREHRSRKFYDTEDQKLALKFAKSVDKELGDFLKVVALFGSATKQNREGKHDIDVLLVVDDADLIVTKELSETYRVIVEQAAVEITPRIHISTLKLTSYWEKVRNGDPVVMNVLREGIPLIDKGFFRATQALLTQGRIRPTKESIWTYYARSPVSIKNARRHVMQACVDLYWASIDAAHAALMSRGALPPSPEHVPDMMDEYLVRKGLLHKKYPVVMRELYDLSKHIEHRDIKAVAGSQYDDYLKETLDLVDSLRRIVKEQEKK